MGDKINKQFDEFQKELEVRNQHLKLMSKIDTDEIDDFFNTLNEIINNDEK